MAMYYFETKSTSYAILETGMGGRFDSTNFCDPVVSVITSVSYDHMDKLGERIEQIAFEKAGIIKHGRPVVVGYQVHDVKEIFRKKSEDEGSPCYMVSDLCSYEIESHTPLGTRFSADIDGLSLEHLYLSLCGKHQVENAVTALLSMKLLRMLPNTVALRSALKNVFLPARLELIERKRRFLLDSAHNGDSARVLVQALRTTYPRNKLITVAGIVKGKDVQGILRHLSEISDVLIVTEPLTHKELDTDYVFRVARELFPEALLIPDIYEAIRYAERHSNERDLVLITGSFYTTSPARSYLLEKKGERTVY